MAGFKHLVLLALGGTQAWEASAKQVKRQDTTTKYCPGGTQICFSEYVVESQNLIYRIAIPDVDAAPFDILLQIVAPKTIGWAGLAWGGKMSNNPLTIGWPNGNKPIVSSRWTSGKSLPGAYAGAKYTTLPTSTSNSTHWQLDVLCQGCSQWSGGSLNPNGQNALAWAKANRAVATASSNTSSFSAHDAKAIFAHDLSQAKIPKGVFDAVAYDLENSSTPAAPASAPPSVQTSVVTLPKPSAASSPVLGPLPIPTRLTVLPDPPVSSASQTRVVITTRVTQLPKPSTSTVYVYPSSSTKKLSTSTVLVFPTQRPPTTVVTVIQPTPTWTPPNQGGGGGWGKGKWGGGRGGGGPGRGGRRPGEGADEE
ncbi:cellobiose dehydrogenase [Rhypophila sp. PSN 637]